MIGHLAPERGNPLLARARHALDADSPRPSLSFRGISLAGRLQPFVSKIKLEKSIIAGGAWVKCHSMSRDGQCAVMDVMVTYIADS